MRAAKLLTGISLVLTTCSVQAADEAKFDAAKLTGTWTYVSGERNGEVVDQERFKGSKVTITPKTITLEGPTGKFVMEYKLDTKKNPVTMSMTMTESPFGAGATAEGIVQVSGADLKICYTPMGSEAPKKFEAKKDSNHHLFVLKRSK
jgi:uncharacterized protein (TIGR03067 family)